MQKKKANIEIDVRLSFLWFCVFNRTTSHPLTLLLDIYCDGSCCLGSIDKGSLDVGGL